MCDYVSECLNMKKVEYIYFFASSGVNKKIKGTVNALNDLGFLAVDIPITGSFFSRRVNLIFNLVTTKADVIILRHDFLLAALYLPFFIFLRCMGKKIIVDIPSPLIVAAKEHFSIHNFSFAGLVKIVLLFVQHPWSLWPVNLILEYAEESSFFSFGLKSKILYTTNGIDVSQIPSIPVKENYDGNFNMIAVGEIAFWHGYDRLIKGMRDFFIFHPEQKTLLFFHVVGDGSDVENLKKMADELGLSENVIFHGHKTGDALSSIYANANLAVGTLGLHRKAGSNASPLKNREYCAYGLPFVMSHFDADFANDVFFCLQEVPTDDPINVGHLLNWASDQIRCSPDGRQAIKDYAYKFLDFRFKWKKILDELVVDNTTR